MMDAVIDDSEYLFFIGRKTDRFVPTRVVLML